jgi:hypothetical protein
MDFTLEKLELFLKSSFSKCYLGEFKKASNIQRPSFFEMEYAESDWNYRDSFTGFYSSSGQEIIRYKGNPVWSSSYGGGVTDKYIGNLKFFTKLESFLIESLSQDSGDSFSLRGPELFEKEDWRYICKSDGDMQNFSGIEEIQFKGEKVFEHRFFGGLIKSYKTNRYISYLMGSDNIKDEELINLGIYINEADDLESRELAIPSESINDYERLLIEKLNPGFWNEYMDSNEIKFLFKSPNGEIHRIIYSEKTSEELSQMCAEYSGDSIDRTRNLLDYLSKNTYYTRHIKKFF